MSQTKFDELKETLKTLIQRDLDEASVTGAIDGGEGPPKTPFAFRGKRKKDKKVLFSQTTSDPEKTYRLSANKTIF